MHAQLTCCTVVISALCDGDGDAAPGDRGGGVPRAPLPPPLQHPRHPGIQIPLREIICTTYGNARIAIAF